MQILVVDDEPEIADLVSLYLTNENFVVHTCYTAQQALDYLEATPLSLAILDVMLPGMDGFALCRRIRETHTFPVIMLTARSSDLDKITGLTIGADDYLTKPFNPLELVARVKAQLRRATRYSEGVSPDNRNLLDFGGLVIDRSTHECTINDQPVLLTPIEFSILWHLCENRGQVISSEQLFRRVWGEKYYDGGGNTVMVHIRHLREKIEKASGRRDLIQTVWGVGYKIEK
ncbi:MAG: VanR-ABDEGLN family response regulator transcription factor [Clostridiales bacterium]|nr:VanR-ABDEGLN family response regulator transcription factor [Clostridiales bacterium]